MPIWKRHVGVLGMVLVLIGICSIGVAQIDVTFPWTQPGSYTGNAIDFGAVPVGQTKTATYTFKILETSETSATVTIVRPNPPFGSDAPIEPFTLAPGQSITFNVTSCSRPIDHVQRHIHSAGCRGLHRVLHHHRPGRPAASDKEADCRAHG
jgi:hypothetical protein